MFILMLPVRNMFRFPRRCRYPRLALHRVRQAQRRQGLALHRRRGLRRAPALHPPPLLVLPRVRQPLEPLPLEPLPLEPLPLEPPLEPLPLEPLLVLPLLVLPLLVLPLLVLPLLVLPLLVLPRARQPLEPLPRGLHRRDRKGLEDQAPPAPRSHVLPLLRAPCRRPLRRRLLHRRPLFPRVFRVREKRNEGPFRAAAHLLGLGTFVIRVPCENSAGDC